MDPEKSTDPASSKWKPLRIWPALVLLGLMVLFRNLASVTSEQSMGVMMTTIMGPALCGILILFWWLTASRATWKERLVGFFGAIVGFLVFAALLHPTMIGSSFLYPMIPLGTAAFAIIAIFLRRNPSFLRTWLPLLAALLVFGSMTLLRNKGMSGDYQLDLHPRWEASAEEQLMAGEPRGNQEPETQAKNLQEALQNSEWSGFRGPERNSVSDAPQIGSDWEKNPPEPVWKKAVGPGWSSFAVAGNFLITQEQRGPMDAVVCYDAGTGEQIWSSKIESRFEEPLGGPGPRGTPTIAAGKIFAMTAEKWLLCVSPTGKEIWKQDIEKVAGRKAPQWGFSSSPLVVGSKVIIHAGGKSDKGTLAFDIDTGELQWSAASGDHSYSSPQLATVAGKECVLMASNRGVELLDPESGESLLDYSWKENTYRALQPQVIDGSDILLPTGMNFGTRRIHVSEENGKFSSEDVWISKRLKPDFNDFVIFEGHAYGYDASIFTSIDLKTGERNWKGGRYGKGQVLLLEKSGMLLVAGEQGEVVLLKATPEAHTELTKFQALEGKTWNHPVVVGDKLYIRNDREAACYKLPLAE